MKNNEKKILLLIIMHKSKFVLHVMNIYCLVFLVWCAVQVVKLGKQTQGIQAREKGTRHGPGHSK